MLDWLNEQYSVQALWSAWGAVFLGYAGFIVLERFLPAQRHPGGQAFLADVRANIAFVLLNPVAVFVGALLSRPVANVLGGPLFRVDLNGFAAGSFSKFLLAFVPFLVFDFFYYWFHRFQHAWPWLWQVHRLHHSEAFLNVTTNYRHHWLEEFFRAFFIFLPMNFLISISAVESVVAAFVIRQWSSFFHANIKVSFGPFTSVIAGPQYHRIHHSIEKEHVGNNFAAFFPLWDWIFRTYHRPKRGEWPETGLPDTNGIWGFKELLFAPFIGWWRRLEGRLVKTANPSQ
jgi:sterol desaturase/sphingolipid hydroxylase (fatty acid hydroxylase superfamily)